LQPGQIASLLGVLKEPARTMVLLGVLTGLRIGEILALTWAYVDFIAGEIKVERAYYRGLLGIPKTKCSPRTVPLPQSLALALVSLKARQQTKNGENELVFQTRNATPYSDTNLLHRQLKPAGRKPGIPEKTTPQSFGYSSGICHDTRLSWSRGAHEPQAFEQGQADIRFACRSVTHTRINTGHNAS
jgi:integrase